VKWISVDKVSQITQMSSLVMPERMSYNSKQFAQTIVCTVQCYYSQQNCIFK